MLPIAIVLSFVLCASWIFVRSLTDALINVYLPIFILIPAAYVWDIPHLMVLNPVDAAILPLAVGAIIKYPWKFQRLDLWLLLFMLEAAFPYAEFLGFTVGIHRFAELVFTAFLPYVVGKLLLEQPGIRERFLRRLLWLMAFVAVVEVVEFRLGINFFTAIANTISPQHTGAYEQVRGGFLRAQGPFGHAITAGMVFGSAWILALWLGSVDKSNRRNPERRFFGVRPSLVLPWALFGGLLMAWSRGPWMGAALGFAVSRIGYARRVRATALIVILSIAVGGTAAYAYFESYTSVDYWSAGSYEQQTAIYRKELVTAYVPVVAVGGYFGWGEFFPRVGGQSSIDNEYLFLRLTQGSLGFLLFFLITGEAALALIRSARGSPSKSDFAFALSMLAVFGGILASVLTVSLGVPAYQLFFLFIGWSCSLRQTNESSMAITLPALATESRPRIFA